MARDAHHRRADCGDGHRCADVAHRLGREVRRHQGEGIVLADEGQILAALRPALPDGVQGLDIFLQARRRRAPRHGEAAFVVALHLAAEAEHESPARCGLQIPRRLRHHHRAARKGNGDAGRQLDALCRGGCNGQRQERLVRIFLRDDAVIACILDLPGKRTGILQGHPLHRELDFHSLSPSNAGAGCSNRGVLLMDAALVACMIPRQLGRKQE